MTFHDDQMTATTYNSLHGFTVEDDGAPVEQWEYTTPADVYSSDVEMGMYDDDPNPYHGDYSEM